jgi:serine/threonine-protein kinase
MSPEQATGDMSVGAATDVYALGCVLYEMLVGEPPFTGSTPQAILGKIIAGGLDSARDQRRSVPPNVDAAIRRALERVPADRFESAQAFAEALEDASFRHETLVGSSAWRGDSGRRSWTPAWAMTMTVVATLATAGLAWQLARDEPAAPVSRQYFSTEGWASSLGIGLHGALAPDGSSMVLPVESDVGGQQLGLKLRQSVAIEPIAGTDGAIKATYSPDGRSIVFVVGSALRKRSVLGGSTVTLAEDVALGGPGLAWLDDGTILYDQEAEAFEGSARVMQISAEDGSRLRSVLELAEIYHIEGLPGGRGALVIGCPAASCVGGVVGAYLVDLRQGASERILEGVDRVWYAPSGHLVYVRSGGSVLAAAFDLAEMSLTGPETPLFEGVRYISGEAEMLLGADGTLLYVGASLAARTTARRLVVVDLAGREQPIDLPPQDFASPIWSPDGESIAYRSGGQIYTYDVRRRTPPRQLTFEGDNGRPVFSPDGRTIAFSSTREDTRGPDIFLKDLTDDSPARSLGALEGAQYVTQWPSASLLLIENVAGSIGLWTVDLSDPGSARPAPYLTAETQLASMVLSPDGKLAAYRSSVSGTWEIRISSFPTPGEPTVVARSTLQAGWPSWSPDGAVLYYERQARIGDLRGVHMAARIQREPVTAVLASDSLFTTPLGYRAPTPGLGMHPAGDRWILLQDVLPGGADGTGSYRPILVENWFEELRERMGRE